MTVRAKAASAEGRPIIATGWGSGPLAEPPLAGETGVVDLDAAPVPALAVLAGATAERVTIVVPSMAQLRLAMAPARLLGETDQLVVRFTHDEPRRSWSRLGDLSGVLETIDTTSGCQPPSEVFVKTTRPVAVVRLVRALVGGGDDVLPAPLRIGLADRAAERFVPGNAHVRYLGVDDVVEAGGQVVSLVDVTVETTAEPRECGPGGDGAPPTVRVLARGRAWSADELAGGVDRIFVLPPVDTRVVNPTGFVRDAPSRSGRCVAGPGNPRTTLIVDDADNVVTEVPSEAALASDQIRGLRRLRRLQCDGEAFDGPIAHARLLTQLAAAGVPLVAPALPREVRALVGPEVSDEVAAITDDTTDDPLLREAASVRLRRAALWAHSTSAWSNGVAKAVGHGSPRQPSVSVVLVTRRPQFLRRAMRQLARQTWSRLEIVLGLHGEHFPKDTVNEALRDVPQPVTVVDVPGELPLGEALNRATDACRGSWVSKVDDDDLYGPDHVGDLLLAAAYSGATIVGKGSEYVLLEELGITVRNPGHRSERRVQWVAGGTLTCRRQTLEEVGGWRPVASSVDLALLRQVLDAGGTVYRTHGMGYILRRHRHGHTWDPGLGHFLRGDGLQWRASSPLQEVVLNTSAP